MAYHSIPSVLFDDTVLLQISDCGSEFSKTGANVSTVLPYQLPLEVEEKILRLMDYFSLNYGAIDIILTPDGRHVFLELNPSGEFFWLERAPGLPISRAIADLLLGRSPAASPLLELLDYTSRSRSTQASSELHALLSRWQFCGATSGTPAAGLTPHAGRNILSVLT